MSVYAVRHGRRRRASGTPELHDDGGADRRFDVFIEPDDIRVVQGGQYGRLGAEQVNEFRVGQEIAVQVFDRYQGPVGSCLASITSPNPPEPSAFSSVYPGTFHSGM